MTTRDLVHLFQVVAVHSDVSADLLLIGDGAAVIESGPRGSPGLDLEIRVRGPDPNGHHARDLLRALVDAGKAMQIGIAAGERIVSWGTIAWGDYRSHWRLWKTFGNLHVSLLKPEYFTLTKLSRATPADMADLRLVLMKYRTSWRALASACGQTLQSSPPSTAQAGFRRIVEYFFESEGPRIWGTRFASAVAVEEFRRCSVRPG